jgi:hypothetical protein
MDVLWLAGSGQQAEQLNNLAEGHPLLNVGASQKEKEAVVTSDQLKKAGCKAHHRKNIRPQRHNQQKLEENI